jgi:hypothetical protein
VWTEASFLRSGIYSIDSFRAERLTSNQFYAGEIDQKSSKAFVDAVGMISHFWNS